MRSLILLTLLVSCVAAAVLADKPKLNLPKTFSASISGSLDMIGLAPADVLTVNFVLARIDALVQIGSWSL